MHNEKKKKKHQTSPPLELRIKYKKRKIYAFISGCECVKVFCAGIKKNRRKEETVFTCSVRSWNLLRIYCEEEKENEKIILTTLAVATR